MITPSSQTPGFSRSIAMDESEDNVLSDSSDEEITNNSTDFVIPETDNEQSDARGSNDTSDSDTSSGPSEYGTPSATFSKPQSKLERRSRDLLRPTLLKYSNKRQSNMSDGGVDSTPVKHPSVSTGPLSTSNDMEADRSDFGANFEPDDFSDISDFNHGLESNRDSVGSVSAVGESDVNDIIESGHSDTSNVDSVIENVDSVIENVDHSIEVNEEDLDRSASIVGQKIHVNHDDEIESSNVDSVIENVDHSIEVNEEDLDRSASIVRQKIHVNQHDDIESVLSDNSSEKTFENIEVTPSGSPTRLSLVDLTQSDSSLQNSPVGATRKHTSPMRNMQDIVAELSSVTNDIMVKEALLDSVNIHTLPDNGRNLISKVSELKKRKDALERELHGHEEYIAQERELKEIQSSKIKAMTSTKQTTLGFPSTSFKMETHKMLSNGNGFKMESREHEDDDEEYSPNSVKGFNESKMPDWGDLPQPDMTISNFGKKAMETHMNQKTLTMEALATLHQALKTCPSEDTLAEDPKYLKVELMPHQKHGLAWMLWREQEKPSGGILADDMGLGKTLSMISLILKDIENKENSDDDHDSDSDSDSSPTWMNSRHSKLVRGGTLVVCPASLINQWEREIYQRVKRRRLNVYLYHGAKRETKPRRLAKNDVVITTYNLASKESGVETAKNATRIKDKGPLFMVKWDRIILDEAHMVRNHKSQMALGVCELVGKHRWCLTGTPIQNKELDLYALLKFLRCSPFDDISVWKRWVDNKNAAGMQRLSTMMKSLMLRRTKEELQKKGDLNCLPEKTYELIDVHLDPEELQIYEKVALFSSTLFAQFLNQRAEKQQILDARYGMSAKPVWEQGETADNQYVTNEELAKMHRKMKGLTEIKTHQILVLLLRLRQICCHPGLVKSMVEKGELDIGGPGDTGVEDSSGLDVDLFNQMNNLNINESNLENGEDADEKDDLNKSDVISADHPVLSFDRPSAKIKAVLDLIQEKFLGTDDKAIIVSQWTSMLAVIEKFLKQMRIKFETLSGAVPVDKRQDIVNQFNKASSGPQILLLSLTAGGVGLNLVGANHLLLVDIHWNPQLEAQACDRIYRVGQKKNVFIYRFITVNTIEERIKTLQDYKLTLAQNVLTGTAISQASKLTLDDLKMLFMAPSQPGPDSVPKPPQL